MTTHRARPTFVPPEQTKALDDLLACKRSAERMVALGALALHATSGITDEEITYSRVISLLDAEVFSLTNPQKENLRKAGRNLLTKTRANPEWKARRKTILAAEQLVNDPDEGSKADLKVTCRRGIFTLEDLQSLHALGDLVPPRWMTVPNEDWNPPDRRWDKTHRPPKEAIEAAEAAKAKVTKRAHDLAERVANEAIPTDTAWSVVGTTAAGDPILRAPDGTVYRAVAL